MSEAAAPMVTLRRNLNPRYTSAHVEHQRRHGGAYGVSVTDAQCDEQLKKIELGCPDRRHHKGTECYDLLVDDAEVGALVLLEDELLLVVFDEHAGKGIGRAAVREFLRTTNRPRIEAVVRAASPTGAQV